MRSTFAIAFLAPAILAQSNVSPGHGTTSAGWNTTIIPGPTGVISSTVPIHTGTEVTVTTTAANSTGIWVTVPPSTITATYTATYTHTITSCPPGVKPCHSGAVTTFLITITTTYCPETPVPTPCPGGKCHHPPPPPPSPPCTGKPCPPEDSNKRYDCHGDECKPVEECKGDHCPKPQPPVKPPQQPSGTPPTQSPASPSVQPPAHPSKSGDVPPQGPEQTPVSPPEHTPVKPPQETSPEPSQPSGNHPEQPSHTPGSPTKPSESQHPTHPVVVAGSSRSASGIAFVGLALGVAGGLVFL